MGKTVRDLSTLACRRNGDRQDPFPQLCIFFLSVSGALDGALHDFRSFPVIGHAFEHTTSSQAASPRMIWVYGKKKKARHHPQRGRGQQPSSS
jgi:hypothetical protein